MGYAPGRPGPAGARSERRLARGAVPLLTTLPTEHDVSRRQFAFTVPAPRAISEAPGQDQDKKDHDDQA
jgi:hypothetical protein